MSLLKALLEASDGGAVKALASNFELSNAQAGSAIARMLPALTGGLKSNVAKPGGLDALLGALTKGNHDRYLDNPSQLGNQATIDDGNKILGHLLGNKEVSRKVAGQASEETGIDVGILKKMLPMVAALAMGTMKKQSGSGGLLSGILGAGQGATAAPSQQSGGLLSSFLDADGDGSVADDILGMVAKKFF